MSLIDEVKAWFTENGVQKLLVKSDSESIESVALNLKFWEMKGLSISQVEDTYNFDFVVLDNCVPVISNGKFVIVLR